MKNLTIKEQVIVLIQNKLRDVINDLERLDIAYGYNKEDNRKVLSVRTTPEYGIEKDYDIYLYFSKNSIDSSIYHIFDEVELLEKLESTLKPFVEKMQEDF